MLGSFAPWPAALAGLDLAALAARVEASLREHGARTQPQPVDLVLQRRGPLRAMGSFVLEGDRIARAVVTHVRSAPFFAGLALVIHPRPSFDAPLLVGDLMVLPHGRARAFVDTVGPAIHRPWFAARFREPLLAALGDMKRTSVPEWLAPWSGGTGGRLRAPLGRGAPLGDLLVRTVDAYLRALRACPPAEDPPENRSAARHVADTVRTHGPAGRQLARVFGDAVAKRTLDLLWHCEPPQNVPPTLTPA